MPVCQVRGGIQIPWIPVRSFTQRVTDLLSEARVRRDTLWLAGAMVQHAERTPPRVRLGEDDGRAALLVDGVVQSISPADGAARGGYWAAMLPRDRPGRALILGLGGGTLAHLLVQRWGRALSIVGVEQEQAVLDTATAAGWLPLAGLSVVRTDAFAFVEASADHAFDYVALDLYRGRQFVGRGLTRPFLRQLRRALAPRGWLAVNLFRDAYTRRRIARIERVFRVHDLVQVRENVVVHARRG